MAAHPAVVRLDLFQPAGQQLAVGGAERGAHGRHVLIELLVVHDAGDHGVDIRVLHDPLQGRQRRAFSSQPLQLVRVHLVGLHRGLHAAGQRLDGH